MPLTFTHALILCPQVGAIPEPVALPNGSQLRTCFMCQADVWLFPKALPFVRDREYRCCCLGCYGGLGAVGQVLTF